MRLRMTTIIQIEFITVILPDFLRRCIDFFKKLTTLRPKSVSYTHLDVYKRQPIDLNKSNTNTSFVVKQNYNTIS